MKLNEINELTLSTISEINKPGQHHQPTNFIGEINASFCSSQTLQANYLT